MNLQAKPLTAEAFAPFGQVLLATRDGFQPLVVEPEAPGWQAALNKVVLRAATTIHRHFNTRECFAPLSGEPVVLVAPPDDRDAVQAFALTQPVCVNANTWHTIIAPGGDALIFICENADVQGELVELNEAIDVG